jgi:hypothetical protein
VECGGVKLPGGKFIFHRPCAQCINLFHPIEVSMFSRKATAGLIFALLLSACASSLQVPDVDFQNGAKRGWIVKVLKPNDPRLGWAKCTAAISNTDLATERFVEVRYWHGRRMLHVFAELPGAVSVKADDQVELWPVDCDGGKMSRISRVL